MAKAKKAAATKATKATAKQATHLVPKGPGGHLARRATVYALKKIANRLLENGAVALREAAIRVAEEGRGAVQRAMTPRVPVQCSLDVAVPVGVAWREWMRLQTLPEGAHRVHRIERDGDELLGAVDGPGQPRWRAEILDERDEDSFAWRSVEGSDCAGLITFHRLSDKLTRLELDLDVLPTSAAEALALNTPLAHRRAEIELRRFKAHLEFINPDAYAEEDAGAGRKS